MSGREYLVIRLLSSCFLLDMGYGERMETDVQ
jgi:hypothetical protein